MYFSNLKNWILKFSGKHRIKQSYKVTYLNLRLSIFRFSTLNHAGLEVQSNEHSGLIKSFLILRSFARFAENKLCLNMFLEIVATIKLLWSGIKYFWVLHTEFLKIIFGTCWIWRSVSMHFVSICKIYTPWITIS